MQNESLTVPIVLNVRDQLSDIEHACSTARVTQVVSWGLGGSPDGHAELTAGAAIGCEDGSLYIFTVEGEKKEHHTHEIPSRSPTIPSIQASRHTSRAGSPLPSRSSTPSQKLSQTSRSTVGSSHLSHLLSQPGRSRVTSAVSKTSAEAPKNYVDFDEEKGKLEDIIKNGPPPKGKSLADGLRSTFAVGSMGLGESKRKENKPSTLRHESTTEQSSPRNSLSSPPSPAMSGDSSRNTFNSDGPGPPLTLKFHIFSPSSVNGDQIVSMRLLSMDVLIVLQEYGVLSAISTTSGLCLNKLYLASSPRLHPPPSFVHLESIATDKSVWVWQKLLVSESAEYTTIIAVATNQIPGIDNDVDQKSRVTVIQLLNSEVLFPAFQVGTMARDVPLLEKLAEWIMDGSPDCLSLVKESNSTMQKLFYHSSAYSSGVMAQEIRTVPEAFAIAAPDSLQPSIDAISSTSVQSASSNPSPGPSNPLLSIPNPFKPREASSPKVNTDKQEQIASGRVVLGSSILSGSVPEVENRQGLSIWSCQDGIIEGCTWNNSDLIIFQTRTESSEPKIAGVFYHSGSISVEKISDSQILFIDSTQARLINVPSSSEFLSETCKLDVQSFFLPSLTNPAAITLASPSLLLFSLSDASAETQQLSYLFPTSKSYNEKERIKSAWEHDLPKAKPFDLRISAILPIELELIVLGFDDGSLCRSSLATLFVSGWPSVQRASSNFSAAITSLYAVRNERTGYNIIVGGSDDGAISAWDLSTLNLIARWTVFLEPLIAVIPLEEETVGRLRGCILCVSSDGTIAAITIDGLEFLFLIPGSAATLSRICLGSDNLLLIYGDGTARLWDVRTQEFWRSTSNKIAQELIGQGGWFEMEITRGVVNFQKRCLAVLQNSVPSDEASTILLDVGALSTIINPIPPAHSFRDPRAPDAATTPPIPGNDTTTHPDKTLTVKKRSRRLRLLKALVAALHTFGLDSTSDHICRDKLGLTSSKAFVGVRSPEMSIALTTWSSPVAAWQISPEHTASRLLALVTLLRGLLTYDEECEPYANQVMAFYVASLPDVVGHGWQPPSLSFLASYWLHSSADVRLAGRALFGAAVHRLSDEETIRLVEYWQHGLPCLQPDTEKQSDHAALALLIAGNIAAERYTVLSESSLTDIAKSITLYLHDEACPHRSLAIDLCSRGFQTWQHHVDAMEILRALFNLATSAEKERNVGPQARMAVLQIASSNTPLFMTTLSLDILHPKNLQQRRSILQLVAYLIKKKPLVLYPNLPRLVEAVVKSLDPSSSGDRDAVIDAATEILGQMVKIFPSVDFHMASQRLCVGTSEGAVIMYDLKTATRLYVLDGHKKRLDACSFSTDGRRLVTVSLEESMVRVWKVGTSITSIFMPGAPPRQGHSGSQPYKTIPFNIGEDTHMSTAAVLDWLRVEWPAERSARVKIRESTFTFST